MKEKFNKFSFVIYSEKLDQQELQCLNSMCSCVSKNFELVVIGDCLSDDVITHIVSANKKNEKHIKIFATSGGVEEAKKLGLEKASGDHIVFAELKRFVNPNTWDILSSESDVDADDELKFELFKKMIEVFKHLDSDVVKNVVSDELDLFWYNLTCESEYLLKQDKVMPIVFATNDNYVPYLSVAIESLKENSNKKNFYDIYVLSTLLSEESQKNLVEMSADNIHVRIVNVDALVSGLALYSKAHYSKEMYYRILIPEVLWQYNKVLYLDCDICILHDVAELYAVDVDNYVVAAIHDNVGESGYNYVNKGLKVKAEDYFNSGILVMNTKNFKNYGIKDKCFRMLSRCTNLSWPDQDVLNVNCNGKVLYLSEFWNFQCQNEKYNRKYKYDNIDKIKIIHYTTSSKPWNTENLELGEFFWNYAKKSPYYDAILENLKNRKPVKNNKLAKFVRFPFKLIKLFFVNWKFAGFRYACSEMCVKCKCALKSLKK